MNRVDFSDINKFITSIGVLFIIIALLLPWYVNNYFEILTVDQETLNTLTTNGKKTIIDQQAFICTLSKWMSYIMLGLISVGLLVLFIGLKEWKLRQDVLNNIKDEELRVIQLEGITDEERNKNIEDEIIKDTNPQKVDQDDIRKYLDIENQIYLKLAPAYQTNYEVDQNIRIGRFNYNVILKSKATFREDLILNIKYYKAGINVNKHRLLNISQNFVMSVHHYKLKLKRDQVIPIVLIVTESEEQMPDHDYKQEMLERAETLGIANLRVVYMLESKLLSAKPGDFLI